MTGSLRTRLAVVTAVVTSALLVMFALLVYRSARRALERQVDAALLNRAQGLANALEREPHGWQIELHPTLLPAFAAGPHPEAYFQVWLPDRSIRRSDSLAAGDLPREVGTWQAPRFRSMTLPDGRPGRQIGLRSFPRLDEEIPAGREKEFLVELDFVVAADVTATESALADLRSWLLGAGALLVAAAAAIAAFIVSRGLRPLGTLERRIAGIDETSLSTRLETADLPAELVPPVAKLNDLLARLDASFARERRFTADVSHELRTPLAGLRTMIEVTARKDRSADDYRRVLGEIEPIVLQMNAMVENLLLLARVDSQELPVDRTRVKLREMVDECYAPHAARAAGRRLTFHNDIDPAHEVETDREKIRIAVANLVTNAVDYTETGGWIRAHANGNKDMVVAVADSGPPIPADDLPRVFDRMWRADRARSAAGIHCGIGLSLSRALCDALGLDLQARSGDDGVEFRIVARERA